MSDNATPNPLPVSFKLTPKRTVLAAVVSVVTVLGVLLVGAALLLPSVRNVRPVARRSQCKNNLKQIGLALHQYKDAYGSFPPAYTVDKYGERLHSWRTLILPFLDEGALYDKIDLSKAWNDPRNEQAFKRVVTMYRCPEFESAENTTNYLAVVAPGSCLQPRDGRKFSEITDDPSQTLMVLEFPLDQAVPWMSPEDADEALTLAVQSTSKLPHSGGVHALFADGSIAHLNADLGAETRKALMTIAGKEKLPESDW